MICECGDIDPLIKTSFSDATKDWWAQLSQEHNDGPICCIIDDTNFAKSLTLRRDEIRGETGERRALVAGLRAPTRVARGGDEIPTRQFMSSTIKHLMPTYLADGRARACTQARKSATAVGALI